jgi:hypothetical protein
MLAAKCFGLRAQQARQREKRQKHAEGASPAEHRLYYRRASALEHAKLKAGAQGRLPAERSLHPA